MIHLPLSAVQILSFSEHGDERGRLAAAEGGADIPFDIKRIFYIYGMDGEAVRGCHANRNSEFVLICVCGSCKVRVSDGTKEEVFLLDRPDKGLYLPKMVWKEMYEFSPSSVLLALASEHYDAGEYIRDYGEFRKEVVRL